MKKIEQQMIIGSAHDNLEEHISRLAEVLRNGEEEIKNELDEIISSMTISKGRLFDLMYKLDD